MSDQQQVKASVGTFLTNDEIQRARKLFTVAEAGTFARRCDEEIIRPVLPRIDKALGQKNSARYLAYLVEYLMILEATAERKTKDNGL